MSAHNMHLFSLNLLIFGQKRKLQLKKRIADKCDEQLFVAFFYELRS